MTDFTCTAGASWRLTRVTCFQVVNEVPPALGPRSPRASEVGVPRHCPHLPPRLGVLEVRRRTQLSSQRHLMGWGRQTVRGSPRASPSNPCPELGQQQILTKQQLCDTPTRHTKSSHCRAEGRPSGGSARCLMQGARASPLLFSGGAHLCAVAVSEPSEHGGIGGTRWAGAKRPPYCVPWVQPGLCVHCIAFLVVVQDGTAQPQNSSVGFFFLQYSNNVFIIVLGFDQRICPVKSVF